MKNNNKHPDCLITRTEELRSIVGELIEVQGLLGLLCSQLEGGGIVKARHLEPVIRNAVPKLRQAVNAMNVLTHQGGNRVEGGDNNSGSRRNPLLM